jgi:hypothetical protein
LRRSPAQPLHAGAAGGLAAAPAASAAAVAAATKPTAVATAATPTATPATPSAELRVERVEALRCVALQPAQDERAFETGSMGFAKWWDALLRTALLAAPRS